MADEQTDMDAMAAAVGFGERLRSARREAGITQAELAERIGVTIRAVQYWEAGRAMPTLKVPRIAATVHRSPGWLRNGVGDDEAQREHAAVRQRSAALRDEVRHTLEMSDAMLGVAHADERPEARELRLASLHRSLAKRHERAAARLEASGDRDRAAFEREHISLLHQTAEYHERRAAYEEAAAKPPPTAETTGSTSVP